MCIRYTRFSLHAFQHREAFCVLFFFLFCVFHKFRWLPCTFTNFEYRFVQVHKHCSNKIDSQNLKLHSLRIKQRNVKNSRTKTIIRPLLLKELILLSKPIHFWLACSNQIYISCFFFLSSSTKKSYFRCVRAFQANTFSL